VKSVGYDASKPLNPENKKEGESVEGKGKGKDVEGNGEVRKG
jgi:hypothetical protein